MSMFVTLKKQKSPKQNYSGLFISKGRNYKFSIISKYFSIG